MSIGRPYILKIDGCVQDGWLVVAGIRGDVNKDYLYYVLSSEAAQNQLHENALGGVVKNLNIARAKSVKIAIPPVKIQKNLIAEIKPLENTIAAAQANINSALAKKAIMEKYLIIGRRCSKQYVVDRI